MNSNKQKGAHSPPHSFLEKVYSPIKQKEVMAVLQNGHPGHAERLWLAGFLKHAKYSLYDVCQIIDKYCEWDDYNLEVTHYMVATVYQQPMPRTPAAAKHKKKFTKKTTESYNNYSPRKIPKILQDLRFRFVKLMGSTKIPIENKWQKYQNYKWNDMGLQSHIRNGNNYGVATGFGGLTVIDTDREPLISDVEKALPKTFTVKTVHGGKHYYYFSECEKNIRLISKKNGENIGDVEVHGKQVVGPTSFVDGNSYIIEDKSKIETIEVAELIHAVKGYLST